MVVSETEIVPALWEFIGEIGERGKTNKIDKCVLIQ